MLKKLNELKNQRQTKFKAMRDLAGKEGFGAEDQVKCDLLDGEIVALDKQIATIDNIVGQENIEAQYVEQEFENSGGGSRQEILDNIKRHEQVFENTLRFGIDNLSPDDKQFIEKLKVKNVMNPGDADGGALLIPTTYETKLIKKIELLGGIRDTSTVYMTETGNPHSFNSIDDSEDEGELVGVGVQASDGGDAVVDPNTIGAFTMSTKIIEIDNTLLQDNTYNLEAEILGMLAKRIWKLENRLYTVGTGVDQPKGLLVAASDGITTALTDAFTMNELIDLEHELDADIRNQSGVYWKMNDKTFKIIKKWKLPDGSYVWKGATDTGSPATILGYPYKINQSMPDVAAGATPVVFGQLANYHIRDIKGASLHRFTDAVYTTKNKTAFLGFKRGDGVLRDFKGQSIKRLTMKAA